MNRAELLTTVQGRFDLRKSGLVVSRGVDGSYYIDEKDTPFTTNAAKPSPHRDLSLIHI